MFLYKEVLNIDMTSLNIQALRAQERKYIPTVLSKENVLHIIEQTEGVYRLMLSLMYGCGLRMSEVLNLRIKDIDMDVNKVYPY